MRQELAISGAIIGTSLVAAIVIAGGPSGIFPDDPEAVDTSDVANFSVAPSSSEPDATTDATTDDTTESTGGVTDPTEPDRPSSTVDPTTTTTSPPSTTTTTTVVLRDRSEITVAVANAAGIPGAAGERAGELEDLGYENPVALNGESYAFTVVFTTLGYEPEASRLAVDAGLPESAVFPIIDAPTIDPTERFDVLLVLGRDQAG